MTISHWDPWQQPEPRGRIQLACRFRRELDFLRRETRTWMFPGIQASHSLARHSHLLLESSDWWKVFLPEPKCLSSIFFSSHSAFQVPTRPVYSLQRIVQICLLTGLSLPGPLPFHMLQAPQTCLKGWLSTMNPVVLKLGLFFGNIGLYISSY